MNDIDLLAILDQIPPDQLASFFQPFQQEQSVLDQQMQIANQLRQQRGGEHASIGGAILGGLTDAVGNIGGAHMQHLGLEGQRDIGRRMQEDAARRLAMFLRQRNAPAPESPSFDMPVPME